MGCLSTHNVIYVVYHSNFLPFAQFSLSYFAQYYIPIIFPITLSDIFTIPTCITAVAIVSLQKEKRRAISHDAYTLFFIRLSQYDT